MNWSRALGASAVVLLAATTSAPAMANYEDGVNRKPKPIKIDDGCTIVSTRAIAKAFGGPVEIIPYHVLGSYDCVFWVGRDINQPPGGMFQTLQVFPSTVVSAVDGRGAYEDQHAIDTVSKYALEDVFHLGRAAYMNLTTGVLTVQANSGYVFYVAWHPAPKGTPISKADQRKLISLARTAVKRAPHCSGGVCRPG